MAVPEQIQNRPGHMETHRALSLFVFFCAGCFVCLLLSRVHTRETTTPETQLHQIRAVSKSPSKTATKFDSDRTDQSNQDGWNHPFTESRNRRPAWNTARIGLNRKFPATDTAIATLVSLGIRLQI